MKLLLIDRLLKLQWWALPLSTAHTVIISEQSPCNTKHHLRKKCRSFYRPLTDLAFVQSVINEYCQYYTNNTWLCTYQLLSLPQGPRQSRDLCRKMTSQFSILIAKPQVLSRVAGH